jgi:hypothetical protein
MLEILALVLCKSSARDSNWILPQNTTEEMSLDFPQ